jgi:pantoate kinase
VAEVTIKEALWQDLVQVARRRKRKPEALAERALRDFLRRQEDEELLARSQRAARRTGFRIEQTEEIIRQYRSRRKNP